MQRDSSKRRLRVAPGIYIKNGVYIAGFSDPNTGKWTMPTLKATTLTAAKRERASLLSALDEGRAASKSELTFDACLDRYLETLRLGRAGEDDPHNARNRRSPRSPGARHEAGTEDHHRRRARRIARRRTPFGLDRNEGVPRDARGVRGGDPRGRAHPLAARQARPREVPKQRSTKKPRRLDDADLERLFAAATPGYRIVFVLLAFTGLRIREALGLTWADVDLEHGLIRVERQLADDDVTYVDVKTANARRELPLYPVLRRSLVEHKLAAIWTADDDPVFAAGRRKPKRYRNVRRALADAVKHAELAVAPGERLSAHSLRHTYTSHLIVGLELDAATTSKLAGHADPGVTMRVYADDFRQASERNALCSRGRPSEASGLDEPDLGPDLAMWCRQIRQRLRSAIAVSTRRSADGRCVARTRDLLLVRQALSQLS